MKNNLSDLRSSNKITFEDELPTNGTFFGLEAGLSVELPLGGSSTIVSKASYIMPSFSNNQKQTGRIIALSLGMGYLL